jgi:hypothetical protein
MGSVAAVLTVTLLVINSLDSPYHPGLGQLRPAAMERTLVILDEERQVVGDTSALRADDSGIPLRDSTQERRDHRIDIAGGSPAGDCGDRNGVGDVPVLGMERQAGQGLRAQSIATRVESTREASPRQPSVQIDVALFIQWVNAFARGEEELEAFYEAASATSFVPAFDAWVATKPRTNPDAPRSPFEMPQYKLAATTRPTSSRHRQLSSGSS